MLLFDPSVSIAFLAARLIDAGSKARVLHSFPFVSAAGRADGVAVRVCFESVNKITHRAIP